MSKRGYPYLRKALFQSALVPANTLTLGHNVASTDFKLYPSCVTKNGML